jgi:hypothetical protein
LARDLGVHHVWLSNLLRTKMDHPLRAKTARLFVEYRRRCNPALVIPIDARASGLEKAGAIHGERRQRWLLLSEFEVLPAQYQALLEVLQALREKQRAETIKGSNILHRICTQSRAETAQKSQTPRKFRQLLFWWLAFRRFLEQNDGILLLVKPSEVACRFLAFEYETTARSIRQAVSRKIKPLEPERARDLIRLMRALSPPAVVRRARGRPPGMTNETQDRVRLAAELALAGVSKGRAARQLFPSEPFEVAYHRTRSLYRDHRIDIEAAMKKQGATASKS